MKGTLPQFFGTTANRLMRCLVVCGFLLSSLLACREAAETAIPKLIHELGAKDSKTRSQAAQQLAGYGSDASKAVPALVRTLEDPNGGVRSSAAFALRKIDTPQARKALDSHQE